MIELDLLGLAPDGEHLTLSDARGNRYSLTINDALRASLRRDIVEPTAPLKPMSPKEVQRLIREGRSVEEVCEISLLSASKVMALAHPILADRAHVARKARGFALSHEIGAPSVEEVVTSRLVARGIDLLTLTWDASRIQGQPWHLRAKFISSGRERVATWSVDQAKSSISALDDEAALLSETQIDSTPDWHMSTSRTGRESAAAASVTPSGAASSSIPEFLQSDEHQEAPGNAKIESLLDRLDSQRGRPRPMPVPDDIDEGSIHASGEYDNTDAPLFAGAHPASSAPEDALDAQILRLPRPRTLEIAPSFDSPVSSASADTAVSPLHGASAQPTDVSGDGLFPESETTKIEHPEKKKRNSRPAMPTWDEIVFGKKD